MATPEEDPRQDLLYTGLVIFSVLIELCLGETWKFPNLAHISFCNRGILQIFCGADRARLNVEDMTGSGDCSRALKAYWNLKSPWYFICVLSMEIALAQNSQNIQGNGKSLL